MLPEKLSTDLTSLGYGEDRPAIVIEMVIGEDGSLRSAGLYAARSATAQSSPTWKVIDGKGCATMRQKIRGSFRKPEVEKVQLLQSVAGPVLKLFKQAGKLLGGKCKMFYEGSVEPPE
jgi:hypothetical protein